MEEILSLIRGRVKHKVPKVWAIRATQARRTADSTNLLIILYATGENGLTKELLCHLNKDAPAEFSKPPARGEDQETECGPVHVQFSSTVVLYFTPSGTGTATGTVVPSEPSVRRVESTATKAVKGEANP